jgi:hypothetical protein
LENKLELTINSDRVLLEHLKATTSHEGRKIEWDIALFEKTSFKGDFDIFEHINEYWRSLPRSDQDKIFNIYAEIKDLFDSYKDERELVSQLYRLVAQLFEFHDLEKVKNWLYFHGSNIHTPEKLEDEFDEGNNSNMTRERTYTKPEYKSLVALAVVLRIMIPIWGEYHHRTKEETNVTFKEMHAFRLLGHANIINSVPMEKLRVYVEKSLPAEKPKSSAILGGLSSEDFPFWILSLVIVRRLAIGDVRGIDSNSTLVTFIFKFIDQKARGHDSAFKMGMVKDKIVEGQGQEGENNLSKLEGYKIKQDIAAGDIGAISFYMKDSVRVAQAVRPDIDLGILSQSLAAVQSLQGTEIAKCQLTLTQTVLKSAVSPRGLLHLSAPEMLNAIAVAQALLWHRGFYELAGLLTASAVPNRDELQLGRGTPGRLSKEMSDTLMQLFPFARVSAGKQKMGKAPPCSAIESIKLMDDGFSFNAWKLNVPADWLVRLTGSKTQRQYLCPNDTRIKLGELVIALTTKTF